MNVELAKVFDHFNKIENYKVRQRKSNATALCCDFFSSMPDTLKQLTVEARS